MTDDPTLQEIVRRGPSQFLTPWQKAERWALRIGLVGLVIVAVWVYTVHVSSAQAKANSSLAQAASAKANEAADLAKQYAQADCVSWHDIAMVPPPAQTKTLQLWADFRKTYYGKDCVPITGKLPPADPRLFPLLPVADR